MEERVKYSLIISFASFAQGVTEAYEGELMVVLVSLMGKFTRVTRFHPIFILKEELASFEVLIIVFDEFEVVVAEKIIMRVMVERGKDLLSKTVTNYEAMVYLHTASLVAPPAEEWRNI